MEMILDILADAAVDTLKLIPFLWVTYLCMEILESKAGEKMEEMVIRGRAAGPLLGGLLGAIPQCGFSAAGATLYSGRVITLGTLIAVFLATSDEMLPIFIAEQVDPLVMIKILGFKAMVGMVMGFTIDAVARVISKATDKRLHIHELCEQEHCDCEDGPVKSATVHTAKVSAFIFLVTLVLGAAIAFIGEDAISGFMTSSPVLSVFAACVVGLIPNCAASVLITELYLQGMLGTGAMMGGLLVSAGIGLLVLFRTNRPLRNNVIITALLFVVGVAWGFIVLGLGITF